jgi:hypothetical protein
MVKKSFGNAQLMPDDRAPFKYVVTKWLKRRVQQMTMCRTNASNTFNGRNLKGCWYM